MLTATAYVTTVTKPEQNLNKTKQQFDLLLITAILGQSSLFLYQAPQVEDQKMASVANKLSSPHHTVKTFAADCPGNKK